MFAIVTLNLVLKFHCDENEYYTDAVIGNGVKVNTIANETKRENHRSINDRYRKYIPRWPLVRRGHHEPAKVQTELNPYIKHNWVSSNSNFFFLELNLKQSSETGLNAAEQVLDERYILNGILAIARCRSLRDETIGLRICKYFARPVPRASTPWARAGNVNSCYLPLSKTQIPGNKLCFV